MGVASAPAFKDNPFWCVDDTSATRRTHTALFPADPRVYKPAPFRALPVMTLQSGRARRAIKRAARTTRCAAVLPVSLPVIVLSRNGLATQSMYSARGDALRLAACDPSRSESSLTAAPHSDCAIPYTSLVRFFRSPAGFRNFIPNHAFTRYCWLTIDSLVKRDHGPPAGALRAFTLRVGLFATP